MESEENKKIGLVLEGGGLRGIFTAGVLDFFLEKDIHIDNCIAVSAGACHAASYLSNQHGRAKRVSVNYLNDKNYASFYNLFKTGDFFGSHFVYDKIPNELDPIDNETFKRNTVKFEAVVSNCETGEAEYKEIKDFDKDTIYIRASSSLPFLSKIVEIDGKKYLDGGITDSIPLKKSFNNGNKKHIVVLTRPKDYRKSGSISKYFAKLLYKKYDKFINKMDTRSDRYNETLEEIDKLEKEGKIFVIRPEQNLNLGRIEKNKEKLEKVYNIGYKQAEKQYKELIKYLNN